ncbi:MAG: helix-turn-helix domain-containing protein [Candidatus Margulisbacteria bacterium]|jgi:transcriptional regulator with XRE-family HTH domain|nr:helix-turn-helix domain-containing protein [Candidatus Margulisiibacteriota bacterium]
MSDELLKQIGQKIRALRQAQKLSLEELAFSANITTTYLLQIEQGKRNPTIKIIYGIASILGIKPAELLPETSQSHTETYLERLPRLLSNPTPRNKTTILKMLEQIAKSVKS